MASTSEEAVAVGTLEGQGSQISKRRNEKECNKCGKFNPNACKHCKGCGEEIAIKAFDWEVVKQKKKTHPTQQRKMLEYRANILHEQHGWDIVVLCLAKHKRGSSLFTYGTPGIGLQFVGSKKEKASKAGQLCFNLFKKFARQQNSANESKETAAPTTTNVPDAVNSENVVDNDYDFADLDMACGAGSEMSGTLDELVGESTSMDVADNCGTDVSSGRSVNSSATREASPLSSIRSGSTVTCGGVGSFDKSIPDVDAHRVTSNGTANQVAHFHQQAQSSEPMQEGECGSAAHGGGISSSQSAVVSDDSLRISLPGDKASRIGDGVAYILNGQIKAVGKVYQDRTTLHGHKIEEGYVCVQLTYVQSHGIVAPLVLGDKEENFFLKAGMFFALPIPKLFTLGKLEPGKKIVLHSYCQFPVQ